MNFLNKEDFNSFLEKQEIEAYQFLDKIDRLDLHLILLDSFLAADINSLSFQEIMILIKDLKKLNINKQEQDIVVSMFKHYCKLYYDADYGFILFLNLNCLSSLNKNDTKKGFVYICNSDIGLFKIGCSVNPDRRIKDLGLGSSIKHILIHTINTNNMFELEKQLHNKYENKKEHSEWFRLDDEDLNYLKGL